MITASAAGDTVYVLPGTFASSAFVIPAAKSGLSVVAAGPVTMSFSCFTVDAADVTIAGFDFNGIAVGQGAGYANASVAARAGSGGLRVLNCTFRSTQAAIMTITGLAGGTRETLFAGNRVLEFVGPTPGDGLRNRIYVNPANVSVALRRNYLQWGPSLDEDASVYDNVLAPGVNIGAATSGLNMVVARNDFVSIGVAARVLTRYPWSGTWNPIVAQDNWWGSDAGPGNVQQPNGSGAFLYADDNGGGAPYGVGPAFVGPSNLDFDFSNHSTSRNGPIVGAVRLALTAPGTLAPDIPVTLTSTLTNGDLTVLNLAGYTMTGLPAGLTVRFLNADTLATVATATTNTGGVATATFLPAVGTHRYVAVWTEADNAGYPVADGFGPAVSPVATVAVVVPPQRWAAPVAVGTGDGSSPENAGLLQAVINAADPGDVVEILPGDYGVASNGTYFSVPPPKIGLVLRGRGAARILNGVQVSAPGVTVTNLEFSGTANALGTRFQIFISAGALKVYNNRFTSADPANKSIESTYNLGDSPLGDIELFGNVFGENSRIYVNPTAETVISRRSVYDTSASFDHQAVIRDSIVTDDGGITLTPFAAGGGIFDSDVVPAEATAGLQRWFFSGYNQDEAIDVTGVYWGAADGPGNLGGSGRWADEYDPDGAWVDQTLGITGAEAKWLGLGDFAIAPNAPVVGPFVLQAAGGLVSTDIPTVLTAVLSSESVVVDSVERASTLPAGQTVSFYLNGVLEGTALTDASGVASLPVTFDDVDAGVYTLTASWSGDLLDGMPPAASNLATLTVEELSLVNVVAYTGQEVPAWPGVTLGTFSGLSANNFSNVAFAATLQGTGVTAVNNRAVLTTLGGVPIPVARRGDEFEAGYVFGTFNQAMLSDSGRVALSGATTTSRALAAAETDGGLSVLLVQNRSVAPISPTTVGTVYPPAIDDAGRIMIRAGLVQNGDTVTADNDSFVASVAPDGTVSSVLLESAAVPNNWDRPPGSLIGQITGGATIALRANVGAAPVYGLTARLVNDPASAVVVVGGNIANNLNNTAVRAVAGTPSPTYADPGTGPFTGPNYATFGDVLVNPAFHAVFTAKVTPSTIVNDDVIVYSRSATETYLVAREGAVAPGLAGETFRALTAPVLSSQERIYFTAVLAGVGVTTSNQLSLWRFRLVGGASSVVLVARAGSPVPNLPGVTYTSFGGVATTKVNAAVLLANLSGPAAQNQALIAFGGANLNNPSNFEVLARKGDVVNVNGNPKTIGGFVLSATSDGSGRGRNLVSTEVDLADVLRLAVILKFTDGTEAVAFVSQLP